MRGAGGTGVDAAGGYGRSDALTPSMKVYGTCVLVPGTVAR